MYNELSLLISLLILDLRRSSWKVYFAIYIIICIEIHVQNADFLQQSKIDRSNCS